MRQQERDNLRFSKWSSIIPRVGLGHCINNKGEQQLTRSLKKIEVNCFPMEQCEVSTQGC